MVLIALEMAAGRACADDVRVAVAANFLPTLHDLSPVFHRQTGDRLLITAGATGQLYAQIVNGAPYDVLLAADRRTPRRLLALGVGVKGTEKTYAVGRLVLWDGAPQRGESLRARLIGGGIRHLALADPAVAPYGRAARQVLERLGLWRAMRRRLVYGASVGQAFQFVASGSAGAGFVALAQVLNYRGGEGTYWRIPAHMYDPLVQDMVLLARERSSGAARRFMSFMQGPRARALIVRSGYGLPGNGAGNGEGG